MYPPTDISTKHWIKINNLLKRKNIFQLSDVGWLVLVLLWTASHTSASKTGCGAGMIQNIFYVRYWNEKKNLNISQVTIDKIIFELSLKTHLSNKSENIYCGVLITFYGELLLCHIPQQTGIFIVPFPLNCCKWTKGNWKLVKPGWCADCWPHTVTLCC